MYRSRVTGRLLSVLILTLLPFSGVALAAQDRPLTATERDQLMQEAVRAYEQWEPAREAAEALERALLSSSNPSSPADAASVGTYAARMAVAVGAGVDSVTVGPFELFGDPLHIDWAAQQVRTSWNRFGNIIPGRAPGWVEGARLLYSRGGLGGHSSAYDGEVIVGYTQSSSSSAQVEGGLRRILTGPMESDRYIEWTGSRALSPVAYPRQVVRSLLESNSPRASECFQDRNIESCGLVLDLEYVPAGPERETWIQSVYPNPVLRHGLVVGQQLMWRGSYGLQRLEECYLPLRTDEMTAERDRACTEVAAHSDPHKSLPVGDEVRASVIRLALDLGGGTPALERIERLSEDASPREVIEAAAQRPAEEVLALWLDSLSAADSTQGRFPGKSGIFWASCFAAFALRSTRWRLG